MLRVIKYIQVDPDTNCWNFTGYRRVGGYGLIGDHGRVVRVHKLVYERIRGAVPEGHELHHTCNNPPCCNPWHLEPLTRKEHATRQIKHNYRDATHCKRGHEFTPENTRVSRGQRACRACHRMHSNNHYARKIAREQEATDAIKA
jgi:hypothetical protein